MKFNKLFALLLAFSILVVGCAKGDDKETTAETSKDTMAETSEDTMAETEAETTAEAPSGDKKKVTVTTSFLNDMVNVLVGDKVEKEMIIPAGEDPHLYVAKPEDLNKIESADLVLYHGLHFEGKMIEILEQYGKAVARNFENSEVGQMEADGATETDPHFWFDLDLYKKAITAAAEDLSELLPEEKENIEKNLADYTAKLDELDATIEEKVGQIPAESRYLITPHDAFNYFARSYNIEVMAPQGISTDSEVANAEIEKTAQFIVDKKIKAIFAESTTNPERMKKLQEVVKAKGFDVEVVSGEGHELFSDSLAPEGHDGDNFLDMYNHNVDLIVDHLK